MLHTVSSNCINMCPPSADNSTLLAAYSNVITKDDRNTIADSHLRISVNRFCNNGVAIFFGHIAVSVHWFQYLRHYP